MEWRGGGWVDGFCRFFTHVLTDTTKQENPFKGKPRISKTTRPIKQNMNLSHAETVNQATKYFREFKKHLAHTLDGHILDGPPSDLSERHSTFG